MAIGDLPEECRILLDTQLMFLMKQKDHTTKLFHDDEWIRSLTEAREITADVPEESVTYDQQAVDPKKSVSFRWENSCGNMSHDGEIGALAPRPFHQLIYDKRAHFSDRSDMAS